jgi:hypothetical protein
LIVTVPQGAYTVEVSGSDGGSGVALAEVYEVSTTGTRLANVSARAQSSPGAGILIAGFVVSGVGTDQLLLRGDGPVLTEFSVPGVLTNPVLTLFNASEISVATNTGWGTAVSPSAVSAAAAASGAFALPSGSADSSLLENLGAGAYTIEVDGANGATGVGLAEVFEVPQSN